QVAKAEAVRSRRPVIAAQTGVLIHSRTRMYTAAQRAHPRSAFTLFTPDPADGAAQPAGQDLAEGAWRFGDLFVDLEWERLNLLFGRAPGTGLAERPASRRVLRDTITWLHTKFSLAPEGPEAATEVFFPPYDPWSGFDPEAELERLKDPAATDVTLHELMA